MATAVMVHEAVGFNSAKQIDGRKRLTLVDTLGLLMAVHVDEKIEVILADPSYRGELLYGS